MTTLIIITSIMTTIAIVGDKVSDRIHGNTIAEYYGEDINF